MEGLKLSFFRINGTEAIESIMRGDFWEIVRNLGEESCIMLHHASTRICPDTSEGAEMVIFSLVHPSSLVL